MAALASCKCLKFWLLKQYSNFSPLVNNDAPAFFGEEVESGGNISGSAVKFATAKVSASSPGVSVLGVCRAGASLQGIEV